MVSKRSHGKLVLSIVLFTMLLVLAGCAAATPASTDDGGVPLLGGSGGGENEQRTANTEAPAEEFAPPAYDVSGGAAGAAPTGAAAGLPSVDAVAPGDKNAGASGESAGFAAGGTTGGPSIAPAPDTGVAVVSPPDVSFQGITAGEVNDNADFQAYLQYRYDFMQYIGWAVHDVDVSERHTIAVRTQDGLPVLGAQVLIYDGQQLVTSLNTPATGLAYFFPGAYPQHAQAQSFTAVIQKDQASQQITLTRQNRDARWDVRLAATSTRTPIKLDVLFLLDSTGSMGDEIDQLKNNLLSISAQIAALPGQPDVHYGLVTYRDRGDAYVTRISQFTSNVQEFQSVLSSVEAAGGGDIPESLNEALHRAISDVQWRGGETVQLIFLVADAPPHLDYDQDYDYAVEMQNAASMGIKIHPVAASNTDDQGEYIFRQIAQFTGGNFIFLTYDDQPQSSGELGTDMHVQEQQYSVEDLDALVVRLIAEELAQLTGGQ